MFGKNCVLPIETLSKPKLEFQATILVTHEKNFFFKIFSPNLRILSCRQIDKINVLQWFNSCNKLPVFVSNRTGKIQESYTTDQCQHLLSSDNSAYTVLRWIHSEGHKESSLVIGPSKLKATGSLLKFDARTVDKIRLKEHFCDLNIYLENLSNFVCNVLPDKNPSFGI